MGLTRLAIANPSANTDTTVYTADNQYLLSVILTNKSSSSATMRVWVQPSGSSTESQYAYIIYDVPIDGNNSYETFRFAVNQNDVIKVRVSTANISAAVYGIVQYDVNLGVGIVSYRPTAPTNKVDGLIWIDSDGVVATGSNTRPAYVWDSSANTWRDFAGIAANGIFICTSSTRPNTPTEGTVIYETDTDKILLYDGSSWNPIGGAATYATTAPSNPNVGTIWIDSDGASTQLNDITDFQIIMAGRMFG